VEQPKIAERFHQAVEETTSLGKRSPLFYILFIAVILTVGFDVYVRYGKIPKLAKEKNGLVTMVRNLKRNNNELQVTVEEKENEVFRLKTLLGPFENAALRRYPGVPEEALDKLGDDLDKEKGELSDLKETSSQQKSELGRLKTDTGKQKKEISSLKGQISKLEQKKAEQAKEISMLSAMGEYVEVATWDMDGMAMLWDSQEVKTPVSNWAKNYRDQRGIANAQWDCGSAALYHYREVMDQFPKYPFTYYVLAKCLHAKGEPAWEEYARTGISILKKTTRLSGHASDHDDALIELSAFLEAMEP
jgi:hypothetical protein